MTLHSTQQVSESHLVALLWVRSMFEYCPVSWSQAHSWSLLNGCRPHKSQVHINSWNHESQTVCEGCQLLSKKRREAVLSCFLVLEGWFHVLIKLGILESAPDKCPVNCSGFMSLRTQNFPTLGPEGRSFSLLLTFLKILVSWETDPGSLWLDSFLRTPAPSLWAALWLGCSLSTSG